MAYLCEIQELSGLNLFIIIAKNEQKLPKINLDKLLSNDVIQAFSQDYMRLQKVAWARSNPLCSTNIKGYK